MGRGGKRQQEGGLLPLEGITLHTSGACVVSEPGVPAPLRRLSARSATSWSRMARHPQIRGVAKQGVEPLEAKVDQCSLPNHPYRLHPATLCPPGILGQRTRSLDSYRVTEISAKHSVLEFPEKG